VDKYILFRLDSGDATATIKNVQLHKVTANDKVYVDTQSVTNLSATNGATVNLYATWKENIYEVTVDANGGKIPATTGWTIASGSAKATKNVTLGSTYGTLPTPTKTGYTFAGWNGKNLFNKDDTPINASTYIKGDGTTENNSEYSLYQVNIKPNTTYTITNSGGSSGPGYVIYNESGTRIAGQNYANNKVITFTTPATASYIEFSVVTQTTSKRYDKDIFQLEEGNKVTVYEPYYVTSTTEVTTAGIHTLYAQWKKNN
ncbi:MAG: InlB B-repeat-containing protein, partial [Clostridia bacterium]|nr:InlB B-repeat-containing protein [Clostridia bacterium]